jgi:hypothetical protein
MPAIIEQAKAISDLLSNLHYIVGLRCSSSQYCALGTRVTAIRSSFFVVVGHRFTDLFRLEEQGFIVVFRQDRKDRIRWSLVLNQYSLDHRGSPQSDNPTVFTLHNSAIQWSLTYKRA